MVDTTITADQAAGDTLSDFRATWNTAKDRRHWVNLTAVTDTTFDVEASLPDQMFNLSGATAPAGINLPASDATSAGMQVFYYITDATNAVTIARDGSDTIAGAGADLTPSVNTTGSLFCLGDGNWAHLS